jgi:uncharacterized membrane protein
MFAKEYYNSRTAFLFTLLALFIINVITKSIHLDSEPFWYDEAMSIKNVFVPVGHIKHASDWDNNPPFYYYSIWAWTKVFGLSEFKARLLGVLFSAVSVCLLFIFVKKYFSYKAGVAASLLLTFHGFLYEHSHEARAYTLVTMLALLSSYLLFEFIHTPNYKLALLLGAVNFLVIYTHYIAGLLIFFQFFFLLIYHSKRIKLFSLSIIIMLLLVAIRFTKKQFLKIISYDASSKDFWLPKADFDLLKDALEDLFFGPKIYPLFLILFFGASVWIFLKKHSQSDQKQVLVYYIFMSAGCIVLLFLAGRLTPLFLSRYLLFCVPFIAALIGCFISDLHKFAYLFLPVLVFLQILFMEWNPKKNMDFRMASRVVHQLKKDKELVLLQTKDITSLFAYYYNKPMYMDYWHLPENLKRNNIHEIENSQDLSALNPFNEQTIIFCQTFEKKDDNNQIFDIFKQNNYAFVTSHAVKGVKISLLKKIRSI